MHVASKLSVDRVDYSEVGLLTTLRCPAVEWAAARVVAALSKKGSVFPFALATAPISRLPALPQSKTQAPHHQPGLPQSDPWPQLPQHPLRYVDIVVTTPTQTAATPPQAAATNLALSCPEEVSPRVSRPEAQAKTDCSGIPDLPKFTPPATPKFTWGDLDAETFIQRVDHAYSLVVHGKRNIFTVPSGKVGTSFVSELSRLFCAYAEGTSLESIALKAVCFIVTKTQSFLEDQGPHCLPGETHELMESRGY